MACKEKGRGEGMARSIFLHTRVDTIKIILTCNRVANSEMKFFPGFSRGFSAKFQGLSRVFFTIFSKNISITYRCSACTHPPFSLHFT